MPHFSAPEFVHRTFRPRLPPAAAVQPYLQEIDRNRWYTNFGPLLERFEARLAAHYGMDRACLVSLANCTLGLTLALESCEPEPGGLCALPSWTFVATPAAVRRAGLTPWFLDVDPASWQLTPEIVEAALPGAPGKVVAAMPVAPFGDAVATEGWTDFRARHGIPVVLDAAAAFDSVTPAQAPAAVSLHATKPLGIGEGGFVLCATAAQAERIRRCSNFGFARDHSVTMLGCNAKLSEYAAAVGLAALDAWPRVRQAYVRSAALYRDILLSGAGGFRLAPSFAGSAVRSSYNLLLDKPQAATVVAQLRANGIEARQWWGGGCHAEPAFTDCPRTALPVTGDLARRVLAIPYHAEMAAQEMTEIAEALHDAVAQLAD